MTTLDFAQLISDITDRLSSLPYAQRVAAVRAYQQSLHGDEATALNFVWPLYARPSQLPPEGDWNTWLILAGRGFGKTRTGAEWVRAQSLPRTPIRGRERPNRPHRPRRTHPTRSPVHHDRGRVRTPQHIPALAQTHLRAVQAKANMAQRSPRTRILQPRAGPAKRPSVRRRMVRRARLVGVPSPDLGQPHLRFALGTTATLRSYHYAQVHRAGQYTHQRLGRPRHTRHHIRQQRQPGPRILRRHHRTVRRHPHRPAGDLRRAHRRRRRRTLETRVDRESTTPQPPSRSPYRRRHRPRHVRQAQQLRDRHRRSRSRYAPRARLRPSRRVRQANTQRLGPPRNPPLRQIQRHPHHRRGQRRRRPRQVHPQGRRPPHTPLQGHQGPTRQIHQGRTRRRPLRAEPAPYPDTGAASTT